MSCNWVTRKLDNLISIKHGFAFKGEFFTDKETYNYLVTPGNFAIGGGFKGDKFKYYNGPVPDNYILEVGALVVTMTDLSKQADTLGYSALIPEIEGHRILHNQRVGLVENISNEIDKEFLYFLLRSKEYRHYVVSGATGTTVKHTSPTKILSYEFQLPPLDIQREIAKNLIALEKKITVNFDTNEILEQMAQAIFKSWFVDFDPVKAKINGEQPEGMDAATASLFPEKLVESELGLIPEGWEASKLENLVDIASSKRVFAKEYLEEGVPFYRGKEITELSKGNSITPEIYISEERYQELKDKAGAPKEGDILITSVGTIGNTYLVDSDDKFYFKDGNLTWVKDYKDEEIPYFLMEWFKSAVGKCAIENIKIGSTQQAITIKSLNGIKLVNPSNDIHKNFTNLIAPLYQKHRANIKQSKALANLRDTLLPKLLSGEIELEQTESIVEAV
ncbi:restriction endonuclease subunit S [Photobacterium iliopiscarium]|uniref:restriction endonuclease subunit S n=1 Tax=Photobacterium iliopiscarium TaxID=56192 RepID=UPI0024319635|nr:restriction endonuclease subunit S [Photobacterium iliopiscarium]